MKIKILHVMAPTGFGGAERVLLTYFKHHGVNVEPSLLLYLNRYRSENDFTVEADKVGITYSKVLIGGGGFWKQVRETVAVIRELNVNAVHTHGYRSDIIGSIAASLSKVPVVTTLHGWTPLSLKLRLYEQVDRFCLRFFQHVFCVSRSLFEVSGHTVPLERRSYLPNAVVPPAEGEPLLDGWNREGFTTLFAGRLSHEKGLDVLLAAFAVIVRRFPEARLVVVGDGPLRRNYETLARRLGIAEKTFFLGHRTDIFSFYTLADVLVLPSRSEGLPMTLLEAMVRGVPVICTSVGAMPDVVTDGVTGYIVPPEDPEKLASALLSVLDSPVLARAVGVRGKDKVVEEYSIASWVENIENVYREVSLPHIGSTKMSPNSSGAL